MRTLNAACDVIMSSYLSKCQNLYSKSEGTIAVRRRPRRASRARRRAAPAASRARGAAPAAGARGPAGGRRVSRIHDCVPPHRVSLARERRGDRAWRRGARRGGPRAAPACQVKKKGCRAIFNHLKYVRESVWW